MACHFATQAVTFDSPGFYPSSNISSSCTVHRSLNSGALLRSSLKSWDEYQSVQNYLSAPNLFNTAGMHIGKVFAVHHTNFVLSEQTKLVCCLTCWVLVLLRIVTHTSLNRLQVMEFSFMVSVLIVWHYGKPIGQWIVVLLLWSWLLTELVYRAVWCGVFCWRSDWRGFLNTVLDLLCAACVLAYPVLYYGLWLSSRHSLEGIREMIEFMSIPVAQHGLGWTSRHEYWNGLPFQLLCHFIDFGYWHPPQCDTWM